MNRLIVAIVVGTVGATAYVVPAAGASAPHLHRIGTSPALPVGSASAGRLAYLTGATSLTVRRTGKATRVYVVPAGCRPQAIGRGVAALICPGSPAGASAPVAAVLTESTGAIIPVRVPGDFSLDGIRSIGTQWLVADLSSSPDMLHRLGTSVLVNWHTGEIRDLASANPFGVRGILDLDATVPVTRVCAPVTRVTSLAKAQSVGKWVLQTGPHPSLRECGRRTSINVPSGSRPVLGTDVAAYLQGRRVVYRNLRTSVRSTVPWPTGSRPFLTLFGRRLIVTAGSNGSYVVFEQSRT